MIYQNNNDGVPIYENNDGDNYENENMEDETTSTEQPLSEEENIAMAESDVVASDVEVATRQITAMIDSGGWKNHATQATTVMEFLREKQVNTGNAVVSARPLPNSGIEGSVRAVINFDEALDSNYSYSVASKTQTGGNQ